MTAITPKDALLSFEDVSKETDFYDDWLFRSTNRYQYVSMYEIEKPAGAATWFGSNAEAICLATSDTTNNELQLYSLPDISKDTDSLSKNRELSIIAAASCFGSTKALVTAPLTFHNSKIIARTEHNEGTIYIHRIPENLEESKIAHIDQVHSFNLFQLNQLCPATILHDNSYMTSAQTVSNIHLTDIQTTQSLLMKSKEQQTTAYATDQVSSFVQSTTDDRHLLCCSKSGKVLMVDLRDHQTSALLDQAVSEPSTNEYWIMCQWKDNEYILSSDHNSLSIFDIRQTSNVRVSTLAAPPWTGRRNQQHYSISVYKNFLSVSGKDNQVRIYNINNVQDEKICEPIFCHDGHLPDWDNSDMPVVTSHCWNNIASLGMLSTTNTGQLHTWMFSDDSNKT